MNKAIACPILVVFARSLCYNLLIFNFISLIRRRKCLKILKKTITQQTLQSRAKNLKTASTKKTNSVKDDEFIMINGADGNKIMISKRAYEQKQKIEQLKRQKILNNYTKKEETAASDAIGVSQQRRDAEQMVKIQNIQRKRTRD